MKLKQIEKIVKKKKTIILLEDVDCQWIGDGAAFYSIRDLPKMTQENIFSMFDVAEDQQSRYYFREEPMPIGVSFADIDEEEQPLERDIFRFEENGTMLEALKSSTGAVFVQERYLKPFEDMEYGYDLYERFRADGGTYIAVKKGMYLLGIICPYKVDRVTFVERLKAFLELTKMALYNEKCAEGEAM